MSEHLGLHFFFLLGSVIEWTLPVLRRVVGFKLVLLVAKRQLGRLYLRGAVKAFFKGFITTGGWSFALPLNVG